MNEVWRHLFTHVTVLKVPFVQVTFEDGDMIVELSHEISHVLPLGRSTVQVPAVASAGTTRLEISQSSRHDTVLRVPFSHVEYPDIVYPVAVHTILHVSLCFKSDTQSPKAPFVGAENEAELQSLAQ